MVWSACALAADDRASRNALGVDFESYSTGPIRTLKGAGRLKISDRSRPYGYFTLPRLQDLADVPLAFTAETHTLNVDLFFMATLKEADLEPTLVDFLTFLFLLDLPFRVTV